MTNTIKKILPIIFFIPIQALSATNVDKEEQSIPFEDCDWTNQGFTQRLVDERKSLFSEAHCPDLTCSLSTQPTHFYI